MAHRREPRDYTPRDNTETGVMSGDAFYKYIIVGFGLLFLAILGCRLVMQHRRQRQEIINMALRNAKGPKPKCHGIWLGAPMLEEWEWRDIKPLSIEKIAPPAVLEDPQPPKRPCRRPWLKWLHLSKLQQTPKCATTGLHPEPKFREGEGEGALPASVEFQIAVLVAMPSPPVRIAPSLRGYMNVGVAGVVASE